MLTHKEVICVRIRATNSEELHQIVKLAVDITTDSHGAFLMVDYQYLCQRVCG